MAGDTGRTQGAAPGAAGESDAPATAAGTGAATDPGAGAGAGAAAGGTQRGPGGRFLPGNPGRGPGRPRKEGANAGAAAGPQTLTIEAGDPAPRRGKADKPRAAPRKISAEEAKQSAGMYLLLLDMAARSLAGPDAALNSYERALIEPPLSRILARHGGVSDRLAALADPLALLTGLAMWGGRIYREMQRNAAGQAQPAPGVTPTARHTPPAPATPPPPVRVAPAETLLTQTTPEVTFTPAPVPENEAAL